MKNLYRGLLMVVVSIAGMQSISYEAALPQKIALVKKIENGPFVEYCKENLHCSMDCRSNTIICYQRTTIKNTTMIHSALMNQEMFYTLKKEYEKQHAQPKNITILPSFTLNTKTPILCAPNYNYLEKANQRETTITISPRPRIQGQ